MFMLLVCALMVLCVRFVCRVGCGCVAVVCIEVCVDVDGVAGTSRVV